MLSSVRRRVLDVKDEAQLIESVQAADEAYINAVTAATENWKETVDTLGAQVMPPTTSIDIEDYSDYKKLIVKLKLLV